MSYKSLIKMFIDLNDLENFSLKNNLESSSTPDIFINLSQSAGYDFDKDELYLFVHCCLKERNMSINEIRSLSANNEIMGCGDIENLETFCRRHPGHTCCSSTRDSVLSRLIELDEPVSENEIWLEDKRLIASLWTS